MRRADWIIAILIAAVFISGIYFFTKNWNNISNQTPDRPSVAETLDKIGDGETATLDEEDDYEEDEFPNDSDTTTYEPEEPTIDDLADLNATRAAEGAAAVEEAGNESSTATPQSYNNASSGGDFLVVAGTFKQEANAKVQLKKFKGLGYQDAEIGKFNKSTYASLIVDRFDTSAEAKKLVRTLKAKGIDAYVHTKR